MYTFPIVNKARKPKFELHLTIYDLNNVPLVAGTSVVKWHLPSSIHGEHRGRTAKCSIDKINHRVAYNYSKIVPIRISIDRANNLTECLIKFEVHQEFPTTLGARDEKITLGTVELNLSEYVEESENIPRRSPGARPSGSAEHARGHRRMSSARSAGGAGYSDNSPSASAQLEENDVVDEEAEEGIVRRHLMQDSKINSTLRLGILMVQVDGERNYVAPPLRTAPMFGGIAGSIMVGEPVNTTPNTNNNNSSNNNNNGSSEADSALPSLTKSRDVSEVQDMYRRALAASWACQPGELPADECIEDIFSGGNGWRRHKSSSSSSSSPPPPRSHSRRAGRSRGGDGSTTASGSGEDEIAGGTLRASDIRRMQAHMRSHSSVSASSDRSTLTVTENLHPQHHHQGQQQLHPHHRDGLGARISMHRRRGSGASNHSSSSSGGNGGNGGGSGGRNHQHHGHHHQRTSSHDSSSGPLGPLGRPSSQLLHSRNDSLTSLAPTLGSVESLSTSSSSDPGGGVGGGHGGRGGGGGGGGVGERGGGGGRREGGGGGFGGGGGGFRGRHHREVDEYELRDDLVAWNLSGAVA
ncbi:hypothetical protein GGR56DRAFT_693007 [Xylariaceae sp. FL0804]|nr:hypothetical protein GGR56DRAFT_693007 [Xylariaceae sp. FL0804]